MCDRSNGLPVEPDPSPLPVPRPLDKRTPLKVEEVHETRVTFDSRGLITFNDDALNRSRAYAAVVDCHRISAVEESALLHALIMRHITTGRLHESASIDDVLHHLDRVMLGESSVATPW